MSSDIQKLIEINEKLVKQNEEIISLLRILTNTSEVSDEIGQTSNLVLQNTPDIGEVYFVSNDVEGEISIYKLTAKNNNFCIDNLIGNNKTSQYNLAKLIAITSVEKNQAIKMNSAIYLKIMIHQVCQIY